MNIFLFEDVILNLKKLRNLPVCRGIQGLRLAEDTTLLESNQGALQGWKRGRGQ